MGTGRNVPMTETSRIPKNVTWVGTQLCGRSWMQRAPSNAASSMSGRDVRRRYQRLFRKLVAVYMAAEVQESSTLRDASLTITGTLLADAAKRGRTRNNKASVNPSLRTASCTGNSAKSRAKTITLSVGEVSIVASADSWLEPES